ncbi:Protein of unknown function [Chitinophaga jiangningensis]|uniref:DUF4199 domain-containing protein n=1 Tax=Chitinophaga jiangningensis TaxID=1419482 RepID=A0A1M7L2F9_9BACT|nr:DUF4199 domain-containing protein [Chitinophaga jiangningensis]SHM72057.1 Protein of unknown function [Chitinophaga jiangningensis]
MSNKNHIAYGLTAAIIQFVMNLGFYFAKLNTEKWTSFLTTGVLVVAVILACLDYAKKNPGSTFGNIFANGFRTTAVITVIGVLLAVVMVLIFPDIKEISLEAARKQMEEGGKATPDQIETALDLTKRMYYAFLIGGILVGSMIFGLIASLIGAAVSPKAKQ